MSLKPNNLAPADYATALKPTLGYEQQIYVSPEPALELGSLELKALNSGVFTANVAENLALADVPAELMVVLKTDIRLAAAPTFQVTGIDEDDAPFSGNVTISPPAYAQMQDVLFPANWARDVTGGKKIKSIASFTVVTAGADMAGTKVKLFSCPAVESFRQLGCKTQLNYDPKVPMPAPVQCGRDKSAYVKSGEIEEGKFSVTCKMPTFADGLGRFNGVRATYLFKEVKEDKVHTLNVFALGAILTTKVSIGESVEPGTFNAEGLYENIAFILAS